jgi:phosphatidylglycerol---prolipoprotein diacylglyceryl transferase
MEILMFVDAAGIHLGPFYLHFYGVILLCGALAGAYLASRETQRRGIDPNHVWDALMWVLISGIIGARLYHVFTPPPSMIAAGLTTAAYFADPIKILEVWNGGLGIPGGIGGGLLGLWLYTRRAKLDFLTWTDIVAPGLALGQAIGRWGNFVNQELYGKPTNLPWGIYIEPAHRVPGYAQFDRFHPTFLYESLLDGLVCLTLLWAARRFGQQLKPGSVFLLYLVLYPVVRFCMELLRLDSSGLGDININQTLAMIVALTSAAVLFLRQRRANQPPPNATSDQKIAKLG